MKKQLFRIPRRIISRKSAVAYGTVAFIVVVLVLFKTLLPQAFLHITTSLYSTGTSLTQSVGSFFSVFSDRATLTNRITQLEFERDTLYEENVQLTSRFEQYELTDAEIGLTNGVRARVVARPPVTAYDSIIVSFSNIEVAQDAVVYSLGGTPLGTVAEASKNSARVVLFSEHGRTHSGVIGKDEEPIELVGRGAGAFEAMVAPDFEVEIGDEVFSTYGDIRSLGRVAVIESNPSSPVKRLLIQAHTNIFTLSTVLIDDTSL
jgi:hypothetical protein